jgi:hypothetical protein
MAIYKNSPPDTLNFVQAAGITDITQIRAISTLVTDLKYAGIWTKMKAIYPFVGGTATTHKFNLVNSQDSNIAFRLNFTGGWVHSSTGAQPDGSTGYADTFLNPSTIFNDFKNNSHLALYSRTQNPSGGGWNIGVGNADSGDPLWGLAIKRPSWSTYTNAIIYDFGNYSGNGRLITTNADGRGFWAGSTIASNSHKLYLNNTIIATSTNITTGTINNANFYLGKINNTSGATFYGMNNELAFLSIGDGLTDAEVISFNTAVQKYQTTLGRQV